MLKTYSIILLPNDKKINDLSEREAKAFFEWFINIIPERLKILTNAIRADDKKIVSKLDFGPGSLIHLGKWFAKKVSTRKRTKEEIATEQATLIKFPGVKAVDWTLTTETMSLCFDVGIYFATVLIRNQRSIKWTYVTKPRSYIDRNWPLLTGFRTSMNPIGLVIVLTYGLLNGNRNYKRLKELYEIWVAELKQYWKKRGKTWIYIGPKKYQKYLMEWERVGKK